MNDNGNWDMDDVINLDAYEMTQSEWEERFKPQENHLVTGNELMFETYGEELDYVLSKDNHYVWTMVQGEMSLLLVPGIGIVDRLGYYVCEIPWKDSSEVVVLSLDIECHCFDESNDEGDPDCSDCEGYGLRPVSPDDPEAKLYAEENA